MDKFDAYNALDYILSRAGLGDISVVGGSVYKINNGELIPFELTQKQIQILNSVITLRKFLGE